MQQVAEHRSSGRGNVKNMCSVHSTPREVVLFTLGKEGDRALHWGKREIELSDPQGGGVAPFEEGYLVRQAHAVTSLKKEP
eukprot:1161734-Pelagomonas_calceolata.AAC.5